MSQHSHGCNHEGLITLDQALASYARVQPLNILSVPLLEADQHVLACDVVSPVALPLFNQSAVDGYALRQADIDAGMSHFEVIGEIRAGFEQSLELHSGQALRVFTGGKLPATADTIARQEIVKRTGQVIELVKPIKKSTDVRFQGEELQHGTLLATRGQQLHTGLIAALSMAGIRTVDVYRQPRIAVLITGDEVSQQLDNDAQVFDANGPMILSWLKKHSYTHIDLQHVNDDEPTLTRALSHALQHYDVVLTTGGVSVGDYDLIRPVSIALGAQQVFWQVAQKPGKPLYFAQYSDANSSHHSYLLGLPGNPAAVLISLYLHFATLLNYLQGKVQAQPDWQTARLASPLKQDSREQLLRMMVQNNDEGQQVLHPLRHQQSHMLSNLAQANALVRLPAKMTTQANTLLSYIQL